MDHFGGIQSGSKKHPHAIYNENTWQNGLCTTSRASKLTKFKVLGVWAPPGVVWGQLLGESKVTQKRIRNTPRPDFDHFGGMLTRCTHDLKLSCSSLAGHTILSEQVEDQTALQLQCTHATGEGLGATGGVPGSTLG